MNDDVEHRLERVTARGAPPELRDRVLDAVAAELTAPVAQADQPNGVPLLAGKQCEAAQRTACEQAVAHSRRRLPIGWLVAASLALAAGLNMWVHHSLDRRMTALLGKPPVNQQAALIAAEVASVTDRQTGQWAYDRLTAARRRPVPLGEYAARLETALRQYTLDFKEARHATPQASPQVDRHRSGRYDRRAVGVERLVRVEHRQAVGKADGPVA